MPIERPVLTARWSELLLLNFVVPLELIERVAPAGTEPDQHEGRAYISVVGFRFQDAKLFGIPIPGHTRFVEINLRYYVRRIISGEIRRAVVFVKEIVPRRAVAATANWLYSENYITCPMRSDIHIAASELATGDTVEYAWQNRRGSRLRGTRDGRSWNRLAGRVAGPLQLPPAGSIEEFIVEHYWGYVAARDGSTREYRVLHEPWRVAAVDDVVWDCDVVTNFGTPWTEYLTAAPNSAMIANGSAIQLFRGRRI